MKQPEPRSQPPALDETPDPLVIAGELRHALADAVANAARPAEVPRTSGKEKRALVNVLATLQQLNPGKRGHR